MQEIKTIKKLSLANIVGAIYASIGFLLSIIFSLYSLIKFAIGKNIDKTFFAWFFTNIGISILISLAAALACGIFGWLQGFLSSCFYNFFAREIGGIKIELKEVEKPENKELLSVSCKRERENQELFKY